MKVSFSNKEVKTLIIASIILGFVFGFNDKPPSFDLSFWLSNYFLFIIISLLALLIFYTAEKRSALKHSCSSDFEIWQIKRIGFPKGAYLKRPFYTGILLPLFVTIISSGIIPFSAVTQSDISTKPSHRIGRQFSKLTEFELSKISISGPFALTIFALIIKLLSSIVPFSDKVMLVFLAVAISTMLPLPKLNGIKAYFGSRLNYVFFLSLIVLIAIMIRFINAVLTLLLALIITLIIFITFYKYREVEFK